jgi:hypothetical protein
MTALIAEGEHPGLTRGLVLVEVTPRIEPEGTAEVCTFMESGRAGFGSVEEATPTRSPTGRSPPRAASPFRYSWCGAPSRAWSELPGRTS